MSLPSGTRVRRYEVIAPLGAGGMGEVYLARDVELDRAVALKILPDDGAAQDEDRVRRFMQEARAAIALSHPNVAHIYDVGEDGGVRFMAMEYVQGETLRTRMADQRLSVDEALDVMIQVAAALASAHAAGIVHRDIKPENVMLRPDGYVKVLDFGLAKLAVRDHGPEAATAVVHTAPGVVMGTTHYMSPEQLRGGDVDARSDVFSLGVMLYELAAGHRPFEGSSPSGVIAAILTEDPKPLDALPTELQTVLDTALAKDPNKRYDSAREMLDALKRARRDTARIRSGDVPTQALSQPVARVARPRLWIGAAAAILIVVTVAWVAIRARTVRGARALLPRIEALIEERRYFEAWDLAKSVQATLGQEERLMRALHGMTEELTIDSAPQGASIYLQRVLGDGSVGPRELVGSTPLQRHTIARGNYILTAAKDGYSTAQRPLETQPFNLSGHIVPQPPPPLSIKLTKKHETPENMVLVDGGPYQLTGWMPANTATVKLDPFFIDRFEVSNGDFERFVRDGGYRRRELWSEPFENAGGALSFEEAMKQFRDQTGLAGPRGWSQGKYPEGRENDPVTGITWFEAAAYAKWAGKKLPTIYEWDKAARNGARTFAGNVYPWGVVAVGSDVSHRANFGSAGPMPVDSLPSGMSAWGAHHFAGNAAEFLRNRNDDGIAVTGGSFNDPAYQFGAVGAYPLFFSSPQIGFRCVRELTSASADQGAFALSTTRAKPPVYTPNSDEAFAREAATLEYARLPLEVKPIERLETADWIREKFSFIGSSGKAASAYLYLPKGARPPYQVIHFVPGGDVVYGNRELTIALERRLAALIRGGRAAFAVMLEGYPGRSPRTNSLLDDVIDLRRGTDALLSRSDIDSTKMGLFAMSPGFTAIATPAVDHRYAAVVLAGAGVRPSAHELVSFAARIGAPKLILHGKYDEVHPLITNADPLFNAMTPPKKRILYEGGHVPLNEWVAPQLIAWHDEVLGPVGE